jgi:hypothetical protein
MGAMERGLAAAGGEQGERVCRIERPLSDAGTWIQWIGAGMLLYGFVNRLMLVLPLLLVL